MKISRRAIIAILLIFFAIFLGHTTETGFLIGDKILLGFGISPWANGQTGFHYPIVIYSVLFIIGCLEARRVMSSRQLIVLLIFLLTITPSVVSLAKSVYFKMQSGLATVEYDSGNSQFNIRSSLDNKELEIIGAICLENYGKDQIEFGIKIPSDSFAHEGFSGDLILTSSAGLENSKTFILYPGQRQTILSYTTIPWENDNSEIGAMNGPDLILFSNNENRKVGHNL